MRLPEPKRFGGLGNGSFAAHAIVLIEVMLRGYWCTHVAFVVDRETIDDDLLVGHDFMQKFGIRLDPKRHSMTVDVQSVKHAQKIRTSVWG